MKIILGRKRKLDSSTDEDDEAGKEIQKTHTTSAQVHRGQVEVDEAGKEIQRLTDRVKELETSLATKTQENLKERKLLQE